MANPSDLWAGGVTENPSAGFVNSLIATTAGSILYGVDGYSNAAGTRYLMVFNSTTVPSNGTVLPRHVFSIAATSPFSFILPPVGSYYSAGITCVISTTVLSGTNVNLTIDTGSTTFINVQSAAEYGE
jgi:hypothetical protein